MSTPIKAPDIDPDGEDACVHLVLVQYASGSVWSPYSAHREKSEARASASAQHGRVLTVPYYDGVPREPEEVGGAGSASQLSACVSAANRMDAFQGVELLTAVGGASSIGSRNHYFTPSCGASFDRWMAMVDLGVAVRVAVRTDLTGMSVVFRVTDLGRDVACLLSGRSQDGEVP